MVDKQTMLTDIEFGLLLGICLDIGYNAYIKIFRHIGIWLLGLVFLI